MKKEELKQLEAKYLAGETTLAEERLLKEYSEDGYFSILSEQNSDAMPLDFDSFLAKTNDVPHVYPLHKRKIWVISSSIAAAVLLICLGVWFFPDQQVVQPIQQTADVAVPFKETSITDRSRVDRLAQDKDHSKKMSHRPPVVQRGTATDSEPILAKELASTDNQLEPEEFYVEVNGVRITNEEEALRITENALQFASLNLKKGMKEVENIKCLSIEL
ncbi:hypothetical protein KO02_04290 [Sphingobacterium sp. ML3W]|uniref:hypothetical protein n=1 Tax=Sphingobacterium sp. ML3W TaxID=1538644 RepID=UPI0004F7926F|nr:hypothetical protein [Sphingobacterium sp. ML3W]AIM35989.1 hypothetical protein KO02_04290 [Sphingobacterium sp. ML3W]